MTLISKSKCTKITFFLVIILINDLSKWEEEDLAKMGKYKGTKVWGESRMEGRKCL